MAIKSPYRTDLRILVVEDDFVCQKVTTSFLKSIDLSWVVASNGEEALEILERQSFDIILMDLKLTGISGYDVTRAIRKKEEGTAEHTLIVAITAYAMEGDRDKSIMAGLDGHITKPVNRENFYGVMKGASLLKDQKVDS